MKFQLPDESRYKHGHDENLIGLVNEEFARRMAERKPFELQWRLNLAFLEGNQYVDMNAAANVLVETPKVLWWQEREVFNHIGPIIETRISRLSRMHPILKTIPGTADHSDLRSAKVGTKLLQNLYNDKGINIKTKQIHSWAEACGSVFFKNSWNPNLGKPVAMMSQSNEGDMETAQDEGDGGQPVYEGDLEVSVVPAQEILPDSCYAQGISDQRSIIHVRAYHVRDIEDIWGQAVAPEAVTVLQLQRSKHGMGGLGYGGSGFATTINSLKQHALVKEYWERPSTKHPGGRLIIVAGKTLLYSGDIPYKIGEDSKPDLPFTKFDCITRPGIFWGRSVAERLIPVQRRYNALRNRKAEYLNRVALGMWTVEDNSVDMDDFEEGAGSPGYIAVYKKGSSAPRMVDTPSLPFSFEKEEATLLQEFSQLSGVSELSRQSKADPGVKSGIALQTALDQDDTRLSSTAANLEQFMVENGKQWLRFYKQFAQGSRVLRSVGKNNVIEVVDWTSADIQSDDVVVEPYSALAESPQQRRQMVYDLLSAGLFNDPETGRMTREMRAKVFEMLQLGTWDAGDDDDEMHMGKAERENYLMKDGIVAKAAEYDDHILHMSRHNKFRITTEFEEIVIANPDIAGLFDNHVDEHLLAIQQAAQQHQVSQMGPDEQALMQTLQQATASSPAIEPGIEPAGGGEYQAQ